LPYGPLDFLIHSEIIPCVSEEPKPEQ
jgi:hypothetical protein